MLPLAATELVNACVLVASDVSHETSAPQILPAHSVGVADAAPCPEPAPLPEPLVPQPAATTARTTARAMTIPARLTPATLAATADAERRRALVHDLDVREDVDCIVARGRIRSGSPVGGVLRAVTEGELVVPVVSTHRV